MSSQNVFDPAHTHDAFLEVELPERNQNTWDAQTLGFLARVETAPGVKRVVDSEDTVAYSEVKENEDGSTRYSGGYSTRYVTYSVSPHLQTDQLHYLAHRYAQHLQSSIPLWRLQPISCECDSDRCHSLKLRLERSSFRFDYTSIQDRLLHTHPDLAIDQTPELVRLKQIVATIDQIDPDGRTEFDLRLNRLSAVNYGCVEVLRDQVRDAPYGTEHRPEHELKTLCYMAIPQRGEDRQPFIVMVNTMANEEVAMGSVKKSLEQAGWGKKLNLNPADLSQFNIAKGEVHPLSLIPQALSSASIGYPVVHVYDQLMREKSYVTTNGGHPAWTTEFRRDTFVECLEKTYNLQQSRPVVIVASIRKAESEAIPVAQTSTDQNRQWQRELTELMDGDDTDIKFYTPCRARFIATDNSTLFTQTMAEALARDPDLIDEPATTRIEVVRQAGLDFEIVKFPQCWRTVFEQLAVVVADLVKERISVAFLDCNIAPLEDLLANRMPPKVQSLVVTELRKHLGTELLEIPDEALIGEIGKRVFFLPKPMVIAEYLRTRAIKDGVLDLYLIGGAQIATLSISKYHDSLMSINRMLAVYLPESEQVRGARLAMYHVESGERDDKQDRALQWYHTLKPMLNSIQEAVNPLVLVVSTSLCQSLHDQKGEIIPADAIDYIAERLNLPREQVAEDRSKMNALPFANSTKLYAEAAATILAYDIVQFGKRFGVADKPCADYF